jgi:hypothetical protein
MEIATLCFQYISRTLFKYNITTNVVSSNPAQVKVYSRQHYVIKFVSGLWCPVSSTNKTDCQDVTEILLNVALNTIIITLYFAFVEYDFLNDSSQFYWWRKLDTINHSQTLSHNVVSSTP